MQAIGNTITMVTQDGTTITVPAHDAVISSAGTHSVAMVTAEGTEGQQVKKTVNMCVCRKSTKWCYLHNLSHSIIKRILQPLQLNLWTVCRLAV